VDEMRIIRKGAVVGESHAALSAPFFDLVAL
jgi:hypothetical protein